MQNRFIPGIPEIGATITPRQAHDIAEWRGIHSAAWVIESDGYGAFRSFQFDGCSCIPDGLMIALGFLNWQVAVLPACLDHDLRYYAGHQWDRNGRLKADRIFFADLLKNGVPVWVAKAFYWAVRMGGAEIGKSYSWGFGRKEANANRPEVSYGQIQNDCG
jgi:hypothetical protein